MRLFLLLGGLGCAVACADDPLIPFCTENGDGFDIEEVSTLESNLAWQGTADGVLLRYDDPRLQEPAANTGETPSWRVASVDVLVMLSAREFATYNDDAVLEVQVYEGDDPSRGTPYRLRQSLIRDTVSWAPHSFAVPPEGARVEDEFGLPAINDETDYQMAWWRFDLRDVIPATGMAGTDYFVALYWPETAAPLVGYSLYNRPCTANWTNYDDATPVFGEASGSGWQSNAARGNVDDCNWPMLKVNTELRAACEQ
jgi:hypothetical protein